MKPEDPPRHSKRSGFWDAFAANWAAKKQAEAAAAVAAAANEAAVEDEGVEEEVEEAVAPGTGEVQDDQVMEVEEVEGEGGGQSGNSSFSKYISLGGRSEEVSLKWNFVTSKLAELKAKSN